MQDIISTQTTATKPPWQTYLANLVLRFISIHKMAPLISQYYAGHLQRGKALMWSTKHL